VWELPGGTVQKKPRAKNRPPRLERHYAKRDFSFNEEVKSGGAKSSEKLGGPVPKAVDRR
jgi:hypothetical protein